MFPGFVSVERDLENRPHLYYFPGIDDEGKPIYKNLDLQSITLEYTYEKYDDGAFEFVFNSAIKHLECTLVSVKTGASTKYLFNNF